jgi:hypothetical protein
MNNENPTLIARLWQKLNNYEVLLKKVTERFQETWIGAGIVALIVFCGSALMGFFVQALPIFLILLIFSISFYWCWKLIKQRKALVFYICLGLAVLEYILIEILFYVTSHGLPAPFAPDWITYLIPGIVLAVPVVCLYWLKRNRILQ